MGYAAEPKERRRRRRSRAAVSVKPTETEAPAEAPAQPEPVDKGERVDKVDQMKQTLASDPKGAIEFKDRDVVISSDDIIQPDISRLEEKEKEAPKVTNNVLAQIEERRRRLEAGE